MFIVYAPPWVDDWIDKMWWFREDVASMKPYHLFMFDQHRIFVCSFICLCNGISSDATFQLEGIEHKHFYQGWTNVTV